MGTVTDKLNLLMNTKAAIRRAIIDKGQDVADTDPFSSYPAKITGIQAGPQPATVTLTNNDTVSVKVAVMNGLEYAEGGITKYNCYVGSTIACIGRVIWSFNGLTKLLEGSGKDVTGFSATLYVFRVDSVNATIEYSMILNDIQADPVPGHGAAG